MSRVDDASTCLNGGAANAECVCRCSRTIQCCSGVCQRHCWQKHKKRWSAVENDATLTVLLEALEVYIYPNIGSLQGEVLLRFAEGTNLQDVKALIGRAVLGVEGAFVQLYGVDGDEKRIESLNGLVAASQKGGVIASRLGVPQRNVRCSCGADVGEVPKEASSLDHQGSCARRYDKGLVGGQVQRISAKDVDAQDLLRCPVPLVMSDTELLGSAPEKWTVEYLNRHLRDIDSFLVLCAPADSKERFAYYDMGAEKNPCGYRVVRSNTRVEMNFEQFQRKATQAHKDKVIGRRTSSFYLQTTLLHREEDEAGPARPVGAFGSACGVQVYKDMMNFKWDWLLDAMDGQEAQMCQLFVGFEGGFSPCHYDPQDNIFAQVRGWKRVLLFHPRHFGSLYPWPLHHPQDRQSRVDFDCPDLDMFPSFQALQGEGIEALIGPGDVLHIPSGWWHHIEMLPTSASDGECISINFWYKPQPWFYGDISTGQIQWDVPLFGVKRVFFQRSIEELIGKTSAPSRVAEVIKLCMSNSGSEESGDLGESVKMITEYITTVLPRQDERKQLLEEILSGRFRHLETQPAIAG